jgi:hypothetical protein
LLYNVGGFTLPFFTFGLLNICLSLCLTKLMPDVKKKETNEVRDEKQLTFSSMSKVFFSTKSAAKW